MKPITPEESLNEDYYLPSIIENAQPYIAKINDLIFLNCRKDKTCLEHEIYLELQSHNRYASVFRTELFNYIKKQYEKEKWIFSYSFKYDNQVDFKIYHPKTVFK